MVSIFILVLIFGSYGYGQASRGRPTAPWKLQQQR
jgi:hypothetical protein